MAVLKKINIYFCLLPVKYIYKLRGAILSYVGIVDLFKTKHDMYWLLIKI
jgi:hypothetical protein